MSIVWGIERGIKKKVWCASIQAIPRDTCILLWKILVEKCKMLYAVAKQGKVRYSCSGISLKNSS